MKLLKRVDCRDCFINEALRVLGWANPQLRNPRFKDGRSLYYTELRNTERRVCLKRVFRHIEHLNLW